MKQLLTLLLLSIVLTSNSQTLGFRQGLIVTQTNDTIICLVPIASAFGNKIPIKRSADSEEEKFPLNQIKYLATATNVYENISFKKKGRVINRLMWLEVEGTLNLYLELENVIESTTYQTGGVMSRFGKPHGTYVIRKQDSTYLIDENNFIETIIPLISDNENLVNKVAAKVYKYEDIESIVREYDGITEPVRKNETPNKAEFVPGSSIAFTDKSDSIIVATDCDDKIFTKVETIPAITGGENALADSLSSYFKKQSTTIKGRATFTFLVTKSSGLLGIEKLSGNISSEDDFKKGLLAHSSMWIPALQNSRKVCAVVRLEAKFKKEEITLKIISN